MFPAGQSSEPTANVVRARGGSAYFRSKKGQNVHQPRLHPARRLQSVCFSWGRRGGQQRPGPWSGYAVGRHSDTPVVRLLFPLSSRAGPQGRRSGSGSAVPPCETFSLTGCASLAAFPPAAWRLRLHISGTPCGELEETHAFLHARKPIAGSHKLPGTKMSLHLSVTVPD